MIGGTNDYHLSKKMTKLSAFIHLIGCMPLKSINPIMDFFPQKPEAS
jgi:hypothetical protein